MSGHSKWAGIKHQKAIADNRRGQAFTKLANLITVAARHGDDPEMNYRLRLAINKAKAANMPTANIERSIKRGAGKGDGSTLDEIVYEGYGPGGVAIMIEVATDNRNRAAAEVRSTLSKHGGRLVEAGSVAYQFKLRGVITLKAEDLEEAALQAIEAGADDVEEDGDQLLVYSAPNQLEKVRQKLADSAEVISAELSYVPNSTVTISDAKLAAQVMKLMNFLEELEDVTATHANFDIEPSVAERL